MAQQDRRIGFVGGGAMAEALVGGLIASGSVPGDIVVADVAPERRAHLARAHGVQIRESNALIAAESRVVVLAVKPDVVLPVLEQLAGQGGTDLSAPLWISIAAGTPIARLEAHLPGDARVVRAMPNTPALVGAGATGFFANARATAEDRALARAVFDGVGISWEAPDEQLLDPVTGVSGSGPAYLFAFLEALAAAGEEVGLPADVAARLAAQTAYGAAKLALESDRTPAALRLQVSSPGGTTLAGLARLEAGGFAEAIRGAVAAATARARELADG
ncbi:MAG: pyrroline-5-carboxylate reductase [Myxococcota bacterium]